MGQVRYITSSTQITDPSARFSKKQVCSWFHTLRHSCRPALVSLLLKRFNIPVACLCVFVGRILLRYSSSPHQAWTCMFFFFFLLLLLSTLPPPPSCSVRNPEIKGIARRPHERHHLGGCVKFPRETFPVRVAGSVETGPTRPRGREAELVED